MADNVTITAGTGTTIGADEISSVKYQRVKMIVGADGTNDGDVCTANPMPISDAGGAITVDGTVAVTNAGITSIDGKITACNTGAVVLAAGSAAIGKLAANTGVDIGDVDVTSCALPSGAATSALQTSSEAILTTIDTAIDAINAKLVTGTVIGDVNLGATDNAVLDTIDAVLDTIKTDTAALVVDAAASEVLLGTIDADTGDIKTALELLDNAVDGNYLNVNSNIAGTDIVGGAGAVAAGVQRVTLASDDPAVTDLAALEVLATGIDADTDAIKTAVQLIDNCISGSEAQVDVVAALPAGTNSIGQVTANPGKLPTTDDAEFVRKYYTNAGAVTDGIVWSPAAGKRWYITDIIVNTSAAATITFEDDKAGGDDPVLKLELAANGGLVSNFKTPMASGEDAADLLVTTSAGNIYICAIGYEV
jgi:hypothetical protein